MISALVAEGYSQPEAVATPGLPKNDATAHSNRGLIAPPTLEQSFSSSSRPTSARNGAVPVKNRNDTAPSKKQAVGHCSHPSFSVITR